MARVDSMLRLLVQQGGDTLELEQGAAPVFRKDGVRLRLFFPQLTDGLWDQVVDGLVTDELRPGLAEGDVTFAYDGGELGSYDVRLVAPDATAATFVRSGHVEAEAVDEAIAEAPVRRTVPRTVPRAAGLPLASDLSGWLDQALRRGASDLHLAHGEPPVVRVDGRLEPLRGGPVDADAALADLIDDDTAQLLEGGGSFDTALQLDDGTRLRVHLFRCDAGLAAAFRVLRRQAPDLASLGFLQDLSDLADIRDGLVIVCGPTGSGKSTTMAAIAAEALRRRRGMLVTLEDPIEYTYEADGDGALVRQRQVGVHVEDFPSGLRDALREDPDILLVGEMRDPESIALALTAAETGHLVLASLHTSSTPSAIERIVDAYPPERQRQVRVQLAGTLKVVVAQRLLPRSGADGRVPAAEILRVNDAVANMIREGRTPQLVSALQSGAEQGMITMERSLDLLRKRGLIG